MNKTNSGINTQKLTLREILAQQLYLTKLCFKAAPGAMALHIFEAVKLQISIFFEFTWCTNYVLGVAERGESWNKILWCMAILIAAIAISTISAAIYEHSALPKLKPTLYQTFRMEIYEHSSRLDLACYDNTDFYQKFVLATEEADACIDRYLESLRIYCGHTVQFILVLSFCLAIDPYVLIVPFLAVPLLLWTCSKENKAAILARMERIPYEQKREYQNRVFYLADYARDLRQNPEMQDKCSRDFQHSNDEIGNINRRYGKTITLFGFLGEGVHMLIISHGITLSLLLYQAMILQSLSLANLITVFYAARTVTDRLIYLVLSWQTVVENSTYIAQIRALLDMEPSIISHEGRNVPEHPCALRLSHVSFAYVPDRPVLHDINLEIKPGQKIALVGYNGSGKTTLVKLLLRLYDPTEGQIFLDGTDIRNFDVQKYRSAIGSVFQDFKIYAATLKENVLMDVSSDTKEESYNVEKALYDARFTLRDHRLLYQIETPLTTEFEKDGVNLSGGEAQKVAIARTLYRKQNLIIMDEPSSALDPLSEYLLNQELNEIAKDKTVIFISHRLSTTRDADCIYMMEHGRIIESGTHEKLLALGGKYAAMWNVQASLYHI